MALDRQHDLYAQESSCECYIPKLLFTVEATVQCTNVHTDSHLHQHLGGLDDVLTLKRLTSIKGAEAG